MGHGYESFPWAQVVPAVRQGWLPDTISTDLYARSMNAALHDMPTVMSKFLALGVPLADVVRMSTRAPAEVIHRPDLGRLAIGAVADIAVFRLRSGEFGFLDVRNLRRSGTQKLECELTLREGRVVWDLNARAAAPWRELGKPSDSASTSGVLPGPASHVEFAADQAPLPRPEGEIR